MLGKFEEPLIKTVAQYFRRRGYRVVSHTTLNLAYRNVLSDVDLLVIKDDVVAAIEVKSSRDSLRRGSFQASKLSNYVDYVFIATDQKIRDWDNSVAGLLLVNEDEVVLAKQGPRFSTRPSFQSLFALQHKCLSRMLGAGSTANYLNKYETARRVDSLGDDDVLKECVKEIVTCSGQCASDCPIWDFTNCDRPSNSKQAEGPRSKRGNL